MSSLIFSFFYLWKLFIFHLNIFYLKIAPYNIFRKNIEKIEFFLDHWIKIECNYISLPTLLVFIFYGLKGKKKKHVFYIIDTTSVDHKSPDNLEEYNIMEENGET